MVCCEACIAISGNRLYLSEAEAGRLAEILRQELVCRTTTQVNEPVVVVDMPLTTDEAWDLIDRLEDLVAEEAVDWITEGF